MVTATVGTPEAGKEQQVVEKEGAPEEVKGQEPEQEQQTPDIDPIEAEARAGGWLPKDEFLANPANAGKKWRSAELFVELTPMFEKLDALHKQNKSLHQGLKAFGEHNKKIEQAAYNRALRDLQAKRKAALEESDYAGAEEIRDQIDALKSLPPQVPEVPEIPELPAEFLEWKAANKWYDTDEDAKVFADAYGVKLASQGKQPAEVFRAVTKKVQERFPDLFVNPKRQNAPNVEVTGGKSKGSSGFQLTADEAAIMQKLIASGAPISKDEYIAQIKQTRGV